MPTAFVEATHQAIGRFIIEFAAAEVAIAATVERFISDRLRGETYKVSRDITAMLVGSSRMERAKSLAVKLIARAGFPEADITYLGETNVHIGKIQEFRNIIAHHGAHPHWYDGRWSIQTSNKYNVVDYSKREMTRYTIEDIEAAIFDVNTCWMRTQYTLSPELRYVYDDGLSKPIHRHREPFRYNHATLVREAMSG